MEGDEVELLGVTSALWLEIEGAVEGAVEGAAEGSVDGRVEGADEGAVDDADELAWPSPAARRTPLQLWLAGILDTLADFDAFLLLASLLRFKSLLDLGMAELMQLSSRAWSSADGSSSLELTLNELSELFVTKNINSNVSVKFNQFIKFIN